jgi:predicted O-linked N-acetylglucosamine transferase (SPINDLY family)
VADLLTAALERARLSEISPVELIATADQLTSTGHPQMAALLYRTWIEHNSSDPLLYAIHFNLGVVLSTIDNQQDANIALAEAIRLNPGFLPPYINLGTGLERLGRTADALSQWYEVVNRLSTVSAETIVHKTTVLKQLGRLLSALQLDSNAEQALRHSLEVAPHQRDVLQHWLSLRQRQCEWPVIEMLPGLTRSQLVAGFSPLSLAAYTDDPLLHLAVSTNYAFIDVGYPERSFASTSKNLLERRQIQCLRVGYLSSDLREHAIGHLMAELFELHDHNFVKIFVYYCGRQADDALHLRFKASAETWVDVSAMTDEQAAERIVADEIEILVDVNGYTHSARTGILAMRPAPIIVNWLGFPGTTGSPYHNYIIADPVIIPPESNIFYSESVKRLPCYQPNDRRRVVAKQTSSRKESGLPEDATVFCCFNAAHKITPFTWGRWMRILQSVPGSVLWLLEGVASTNVRLREHAAKQGVAPERIIFAKRLANPHHLARYVFADLFLDTFPYGAHTTGSDALWMGVPVLTLSGRCFASRVCSSLVTAAGLPEMVCHTSDEYVARAIELGSNRSKLAEYSARLHDGRDRCVLFDTPLLVSQLEQLYQEMWNEATTGRMPRPNLSNLDIYGKIGARLDRNDIEMGSVAHYREMYQDALAEYDAFNMISNDWRLWTRGPVSLTKSQ